MFGFCNPWGNKIYILLSQQPAWVYHHNASCCFFYNSTLSDKEDVKKMAVDAMFKLEHGVEDKQKSKEALPTLEQLKVYMYLAFFLVRQFIS